MKEISCGFVPWRKNKEGLVEFLMIHRNRGFWEFPKGKIEEGESCKEAAVRELKEETGIVCDLQSEEIITINYSFIRDKNNVNKTVKFFMCEVENNQKIEISKDEISEYKWVFADDCVKRATYPEMKKVAKTAVNFLIDE